MSKHLKIIKQGAEARLYTCTYLGQSTIVKERFDKKYRHPDLNTSITKDRMKNEARAIVRCKTAGIRTPCLYFVDFTRNRIYMEYFQDSITVKDFIIKTLKEPEIKSDGDKLNLFDKLTRNIGGTVRKLHDNNIIHGDLTTSNILLVNRNQENQNESTKWRNFDDIELVMIDFGLSYIDNSAEDKGVDLYVLERALISTHSDVPDLFQNILEAYKNCSKNNIKEVINKFEEVRARGRKRTMVG